MERGLARVVGHVARQAPLPVGVRADPQPRLVAIRATVRLPRLLVHDDNARTAVRPISRVLRDARHKAHMRLAPEVAHKVIGPLRAVGQQLHKRRLGLAVRQQVPMRRWQDDVRRDVVQVDLCRIELLVALHAGVEAQAEPAFGHAVLLRVGQRGLELAECDGAVGRVGNVGGATLAHEARKDADARRRRLERHEPQQWRHSGHKVTEAHDKLVQRDAAVGVQIEGYEKSSDVGFDAPRVAREQSCLELRERHPAVSVGVDGGKDARGDVFSRNCVHLRGQRGVHAGVHGPRGAAAALSLFFCVPVPCLASP
jgi:hypothetical protein